MDIQGSGMGVQAAGMDEKGGKMADQGHNRRSADGSGGGFAVVRDGAVWGE
jgi:hypothetical protein